MDNLTIMETRDMSIGRLQTEIGMRTKILEELGMGYTDACKFVSSIMNLGIAYQEKQNEDKN